MNTSQNNQAHYDAWLHCNFTKKCNLQCTYCVPHPLKRLIKKMRPAPHIHTEKLLETLKDTNKTFKITFSSGGEPFLIPKFVDMCITLTQKHFIALITNLTPHPIVSFAETVDPKRVLYVHASLHIEGLKKNKVLDTFIKHFHLLKEKNFHIFAREVAYPPLLKTLTQWKKFFTDRSVDFSFNPFIGTYGGKRYPESYTQEEIDMFGLDASLIKKHQHYGKICNAGYNVGVVLPNGDIIGCADVGNRIGNIYKNITFKETLTKCPAHQCRCPVHTYDDYLFQKSINQTSAV